MYVFAKMPEVRLGYTVLGLQTVDDLHHPLLQHLNNVLQPNDNSHFQIVSSGLTEKDVLEFEEL